MKTTESCTQCEKIVMTIETAGKLNACLDLPNTFDERLKRFTWRHAGILAYALVPRSIEGTNGSVDCYLCAEEDDLDDIELLDYAGEVLKKKIMKRWGNIRDVRLSPPRLSVPEDLRCWKLRHESREGVS